MFWIFSILSMDSSKPNKALCGQSPCFCHGDKKDLTEVLLINHKWLKKKSSVDIENYCGTYICYVMMSVYFYVLLLILAQSTANSKGKEGKKTTTTNKPKIKKEIKILHRT